MRICSRADAVTENGGVYTIKTDAADIRLLFLTDDIIRIRAGFDGDWDEGSYSLVLTAWEDRMDALLCGERKRVQPKMAEFTQTAEEFEFAGARLKVVVQKKPLCFMVYDKDGSLLHSDVPGTAFLEDQNKRRVHNSRINADDRFYGFGERAGELDKARAFMTFDPSDSAGYDAKESDGLYKHIPFYIKLEKQSRIAVGYFYHNTAVCDFDMGRTHSNYFGRRSRYRAEQGDIDLFLIAGPSINEVIERYTDLTGKSAMLPAYALGYLGSSMYYSELEKDSDSAIVSFVDTNAENGIPIDGFQLSSGYTVVGGKRCVFNWNNDRFGNPAAFFYEMEKRGVTVSPNVKPGVLLVNPKAEDMKKRGVFVKKAENDDAAVCRWWGGDGLLADFTSPAARAAWKELLTENVLKNGHEQRLE